MVVLTSAIKRYLKTQEMAIHLSSAGDALEVRCNGTPQPRESDGEISGGRLRTYLRSFIGIMVP